MVFYSIIEIVLEMSKQTTKCAKKNLKVSDKFSQKTAIAIVVANMIGTGVFTSLGFQLESFGSTFFLNILWLLGGFFSKIGARGYAELSSRFPRAAESISYLRPIIQYADLSLAGCLQQLGLPHL